MHKFEIYMAIRYLSSKKKAAMASLMTWLSFIGIMLGVAILIIVSSIFNGFTDVFIQSVIGVDSHVHVYGQNGTIQNYQKVADDIANIKHITNRDFTKYFNELETGTDEFNLGDAPISYESDVKVVSVTPTIDRIALMSFYGDNYDGTMVKGLELDNILNLDFLNKSINKQILENLNEPTEDGRIKVLIGKNFAERLGIFHENQEITLIPPVAKETAFGITPTSIPAQIVGFYHSNFISFDNNYLLTTIENARWIFELEEGSVSRIDVEIDDFDNIDAFADSEELGNIDGIMASQSLKERWGQSLNALDVQRNMMIFILALVVIIASFNIISSLVMLVDSKGKDIAIMRSFGTSKKQIRKIFIYAGGILGTLGSILGFCLGIIVTLNLEDMRLFIKNNFGFDLFPTSVYGFDGLPTKIDFSVSVSFVVMAIILSVLASIYPAYISSKIMPAEALRYD